MSSLDTEQAEHVPGPAYSTRASVKSHEPVDAGKLEVRAVRLGYDRVPVIESLDLSFEPGKFTAIIGPNGCGKSTLLSALARLLKPTSGQILLGDLAIDSFKPKAYAREVSLLSQQAVAPSGITVAQLVSRGRFPHQGRLRKTVRKMRRQFTRRCCLLGLWTWRHGDFLIYPAVNVNAFGWPPLWPSKRQSCYWMSRPRIWTLRIK